MEILPAGPLAMVLRTTWSRRLLTTGVCAALFPVISVATHQAAFLLPEVFVVFLLPVVFSSTRIEILPAARVVRVETRWWPYPSRVGELAADGLRASVTSGARGRGSTVTLTSTNAPPWALDLGVSAEEAGEVAHRILDLAARA
jgi:hypothetical protein